MAVDLTEGLNQVGCDVYNAQVFENQCDCSAGSLAWDVNLRVGVALVESGQDHLQSVNDLLLQERTVVFNDLSLNQLLGDS